jgi:hypothetical protein
VERNRARGDVVSQTSEERIDAMAVLCGLVPPSEYEPPEAVRHVFPRHSGRTTRQLLGVLLLAEAGEPVAYVGTRVALRVYERMLSDMAAASGVDVSRVRFVEDRWRERPGERVVYDHHQRGGAP